MLTAWGQRRSRQMPRLNQERVVSITVASCQRRVRLHAQPRQLKPIQAVWNTRKPTLRLSSIHQSRTALVMSARRGSFSSPIAGIGDSLVRVREQQNNQAKDEERNQRENRLPV